MLKEKSLLDSQRSNPLIINGLVEADSLEADSLEELYNIAHVDGKRSP